MATATSNSLSLSSSSTLIEAKAAARQPALASPQCVSLPTLPPPPVQSQGRISRTAAYCRKIARNVTAMATGDVPAASSQFAGEDSPEIVKIIKEAWDNVEDKYAVISLAAAGTIGAVGSTGMISAIDRLPLIPGALELVGIGYTGWFAYKNLFYKPDREAFVKKIKDTYKEITGASSSSSTSTQEVIEISSSTTSSTEEVTEISSSSTSTEEVIEISTSSTIKQVKPFFSS